MKSLIITFFIAVLAGSCAFGDRHVTLIYPPSTGLDDLVVKSAVASPYSSGPKEKIILFQFRDLRLNKNKIGHVLNTYGFETAEVFANNDVSEWIHNAITMELEKAGFEVIKQENLDEIDSDLVLKGEILRVYCSAYFTYNAEVSLIAEIEKNKDVISRKAYNGKGSVGLNVAASSKGYGDSISLALSNAIRELIGDLLLINNDQSN